MFSNWLLLMSTEGHDCEETFRKSLADYYGYFIYTKSFHYILFTYYCPRVPITKADIILLVIVIEIGPYY